MGFTKDRHLKFSKEINEIANLIAKEFSLIIDDDPGLN